MTERTTLGSLEARTTLEPPLATRWRWPEVGLPRPRAVGRPRLFETSFAPVQPKPFASAALGETGWLKVLRSEDYAPSRSGRAEALQGVLFPYPEAP